MILLQWYITLSPLCRRVLQSVTEGKIYIEIERARLTKRLAKISEEEGKIDEAADLLQEVAVVRINLLSDRWLQNYRITVVISLRSYDQSFGAHFCTRLCTGDVRCNGEDGEDRLHPGAGVLVVQTSQPVIAGPWSRQSSAEVIGHTSTSCCDLATLSVALDPASTSSAPTAPQC